MRASSDRGADQRRQVAELDAAVRWIEAHWQRAACWAGGDIADWLGMVRILQSRELRRQAELHTLFARPDLRITAQPLA